MLNNLVAQLGTGAGASASSFESIATVTITSGTQASVDFTSIVSTYKHLQVRVSSKFSANGYLFYFRLNNDSGSNYRSHWLVGNGTSAYASADGAAQAQGLIGAWNVGTNTTNPYVAITDIQEYASTTANKTVRSFSGGDNNGSGEVGLTSSLWLSTSAVNRITVYPQTTTFAAGTTVALYGIKG